MIKTENNANSSYAYCKATLRLKNELEDAFLTLGEYLSNIKSRQMYAPNWSSWDEFCADLKMSENMVNKLIQIYETLVVEYKLPRQSIVTAGGWTVIADLLPAIESKDDAVEWLGKAKELTRDDLRKELKEKKTGKQMRDCAHHDTYLLEICRECLDRHEIPVDKEVRNLLKNYLFSRKTKK